jgi:endonuclease/exonuclease/phosphatase family metal-dependent hydrolase
VNYARLRDRIAAEERPRVVANLEALRAQLDRDVPAKDAEDELLLATWNVRDFGKPENRRFGMGKRFPESHFYIAEVLSRFDFVAVQEVNALPEWEEVMRILSRDWDWIATDVTDERIGGNGERLLYLWDRRRVHFQNIAGELVLPNHLLITKYIDPKHDKDGDGRRDKPDPSDPTKIDGEPIGQQFRRTPFAARFQAGWFKFEICTAHLYYGDDSGSKLKERTAEITRIAEFFGERADETIAEGRTLILLGDFNIVSREHEMMKGLTKAGFTVPKALAKAPPTNEKKTMYYDQIVFQTAKGELDYLETEEREGEGVNLARAGTVDLFENVYTLAQREDYAAQMAGADGVKDEGTEEELDAGFEKWRTWQFSDHFPLWVRLKVNASAEYLQSLH